MSITHNTMGKLQAFAHYSKRTWVLTKPYFQSENKRRIYAHLALVIALNLIAIYMLVLLNDWYQAFYNALEKKNSVDFWQLIVKFCALATIYILVAVYKFYLTQTFQINWREWLSKSYVARWTSNNIFYRMELTRSSTEAKNKNLDNPDQRIQEDVDAFTRQTLGLTLGVMDAILTLFAFLVILWRLSGNLVYNINGTAIEIPGLMVWATFLYCFVGTYLAHLIGRRQIKLNYAQQRKEALFRHHLIRVREYSDSIALDKGQAFEKEQLTTRLSTVIANFRALIKAQKSLLWFSSGFAQAAIIFPLIIAGPRYLMGAITLGVLMQLIQAFNRTQDNLSWIIQNYSDLASWRATTDRLLDFDAEMNTIKNDHKTPVTTHTPTPALTHVNVLLPTHEVLFENLSFQINAGERIMLTGPSGSGKSTLLRTQAGIWPFSSGDISCADSTMFIPQKPYMPTGTLRDLLGYPNAQANTTWSDEALCQALDEALLPELKLHLDDEENWGQTLSLGEQQRIAFARIFLNQPRWIFADEATSALDLEKETALYQRLQALVEKNHGALVSVAHRTSLEKFHTKIWRLSVQHDSRDNHRGAVNLVTE